MLKNGQITGTKKGVASGWGCFITFHPCPSSTPDLSISVKKKINQKGIIENYSPFVLQRNSNASSE